MRFRSMFLAAAVMIPGAALAQDGVPLDKALEMAAQEKITNIQEYWYNPESKLSGVEGFDAEQNWHTLILDAEGKVVRSGADADTAAPTTSLAKAAEAAMGSGITKIRGVYLRDGNWIVQGWKGADTETTVMVNGASGAVE